jgi:hypothetical protein
MKVYRTYSHEVVVPHFWLSFECCSNEAMQKHTFQKHARIYSAACQFIHEGECSTPGGVSFHHPFLPNKNNEMGGTVARMRQTNHTEQFYFENLVRRINPGHLCMCWRAKRSISWDIMLCSPLNVNRRFRCPKLRLTFNGIHGVILQKTELFRNLILSNYKKRYIHKNGTNINFTSTSVEIH